MRRKQLSTEQKQLDIDLWIIILVTLGVFCCYAMFSNQLMDYVTNSNVSIVPRLLISAGIQFGLAGLGITIVCLLRREKFTQFGLVKNNLANSVVGTMISFVPYVLYIFFSGQFDGWHPFSIMITDDVITSGMPFAILGMALIVVVWGFFEGFNYAVICDKINSRYPSSNPWLDYGAIVCSVFCVLFHPMSTTFWGIVEIITTFIAIYGMLIVKKKTENAWGCVLAFCFIWNAI